MPLVNGITQADIEMLVAENSLAAEQLRRIMAERQRQELQAELDELQATADHLGISSNGDGAETEEDPAALPKMSGSSQPQPA
jgi:DNA-binding transcriptional MerR regulator